MKFNRILIAFFAGAAVLAGCQPIEKVTLNLADSTAPVITSFDMDSEAITVSYSPAAIYTGSEQVKPELVYHNLAIVKVKDGAEQHEVSAKVESEENKDEQVIIAKFSAVTNALLGLGYSYGDQVDIELVVRAQLSSAATNGFFDSQATASIDGFVLEKPIPGGKPKIPDIDLSQYEDIDVMRGADTWGIIGPAVLDWNTDVDLQKISDDPEVWYAGSVPFAADKFKFRGNDTWGDYDLGGGEFAVDAPIVMSKGGSDMAAVAGSYDVFLFPVKGIAYLAASSGINLPDIDLSQYEFMDVMVGADTWGIIGPAVSDWSTDVDLEKLSDDPEIWGAMSVPFQADKFKFRGNDTWGDYDLGGGEYALDTPIVMSKGGGDMAMTEAGSYDVFLYPTYGVAYIRTGSGDVPPPPEKPAAWSLIGTIGGTAWDTDFDLANTTGDIWIIRNVAIGADELFKIRADHDWAKSVGGPGEEDEYVPEIGVTFEAGEKNIKVGVGGNYDVTFDYAAMTILIEEHVAVYSLIGEINGDSWKVDVAMTENNGVWTSPVVEVAGGFKIRYDYSWDDENVFGAEEGFTPTEGTPFTAVQPGSNITMPAGKYKVQFTPESKEVLIKAVNFPEQLYMTGTDFGSWSWGEGTVELIPVLHNPDWGADAEGQFWTVRYLTAGNGVKFNAARDWDGGQFGSLETNEGFYNDNDGNVVVAESGLYMIHVDFKRSILHVEPARIYAVGATVGDGSWVEGLEDGLFKNDGDKTSFTAQRGGELRLYAASEIATSPCWTREFIVLDGKIEYRGAGDEQTRVNVLAGQVVTLDFNAGTGAITGEGEAPAYKTEISVPGAYSGSEWNLDTAPKLLGKGDGEFKGALVMYKQGDAAVEFKFGHDGSWIGGTADGLNYTLGAGDNMTIDEGTYFWTVNLESKTATALKVEKVGLIGSFNEWSDDLVLTFNAEDHTYNGTVTLGENAELKVRFNGNWDYSLGGDLNRLQAVNDNCKVAEAGTYTAKLDLNKGTLTLTK